MRVICTLIPLKLLKDFDANSLYALGSSLGKNITIESLMKLLPDQITYKDHMYITKDHGLLKYDGKDANVEIPEEIMDRTRSIL